MRGINRDDAVVDCGHLRSAVQTDLTAAENREKLKREEGNRGRNILRDAMIK